MVSQSKFTNLVSLSQTVVSRGYYETGVVKRSEKKLHNINKETYLKKWMTKTQGTSIPSINDKIIYDKIIYSLSYSLN